MGSPFANDFGIDNNGLLISDGTSEPEISLSDLLDEVFNNHDDSCEQSTSQKNSVMSGGMHPVAAGLSYIKDSGPCSNTYPEMSQIQVWCRPIWP